MVGTSRNAKREVEELIEHQKRSTAVETLFTITLLLVSSFQITITLASQEISNFTLVLFGVLMPFLTLGTIVVALTIGGENLLHVIKKEFYGE